MLAFLFLVQDIPLSTDQVLFSASSFFRCPAEGSGPPLVCVASSTAILRGDGRSGVGHVGYAVGEVIYVEV
jgi:hypothetical protein